MAVRDAAATQRRIVAAALREFAAKGISGARIDAIADRARVNKRMLYYYFGSKEGLFREILRYRLARRPRVVFDGLDYGERLAARASVTPEGRDHVRLLMWEALETRARSVISAEERAGYYDEMLALVRQAQAEGELPAAFDPAHVLLSELALTIFPAAFPQITRLVIGKSFDDPAFVAERKAFLRQLADALAGRAVRA
jgi:TetR/AcrR family transcriptional regulator